MASYSTHHAAALSGRRAFRSPSGAALSVRNENNRNVAAVYNRAGDEYLTYADGDTTDLFSFAGPHAYADRTTWSILSGKLSALRGSGAESVSLLDAGCGPGTWLRRMVTYAYALGFTRIRARGFDIADAQIERARTHVRDLSGLPGVAIQFDVADLTDPLPERDDSIDISVCLFSVLTHVPVTALAPVSNELARVTSGDFIASVRSIGSTPSAFVGGAETIDRLNYRNADEYCHIRGRDGQIAALRLHLFSATEFSTYIGRCFEIEEVRGLDLFHTRFSPDVRWNPEYLQVQPEFRKELEALEEAYATNRLFIDRANHLLIVGRKRAL